MKIAPLKISLFIVITVSILMIVAGLLFYKNLIGLLGAWNQSNKMSIYLKVDATLEDKNKIIAFIKQNTNVSSVNVVDRTAAGLAFQNTLKEFSSGLVTVDEMVDLIPETIEVDLNSALNLKEREINFAELASKLKGLEQIEDISYSADWLKKFEQIDKILQSVGVLIFLTLLVSISYLVALMVRVYIDDSKQEIEIYSLLGATRWSIYRLFLKDIFLFLSASLLASFALLFLIFTYAKTKLTVSGLSAVISENLQFLTFSESMLVIFALFIFIYLNSFITIQSSVNKLNQLNND